MSSPDLFKIGSAQHDSQPTTRCRFIRSSYAYGTPPCINSPLGAYAFNAFCNVIENCRGRQCILIDVAKKLSDYYEMRRLYPGPP